VAELSLQRFDAFARCIRPRRERVSEIVPTHYRYPGTFARGMQMAVEHVIRIESCAAIRVEDQILGLVQGRPQMGQGIDYGRIYEHFPA